MGWLYNQEYCYVNSDAGRMEALADYLPVEDVAAVSWQQRDGRLYIFFRCGGEENIYGVMELRRGGNGRYRALRVQWEPSAYRAGVYGGELPRRKNRKTLFYLAGYDCREIFSAELHFDVYDSSGASREAALMLPLEEPDFLTLYEYSEFAALLGLQDEPAMLRLTETRLLDADDSDVTAVYRSAEEPASWSGSRTTVELGLVYVLMGVAAALGGALLRYILRRDE